MWCIYIYRVFIYIVWKSTRCSIFKIYTKYELNWYFKNGFEMFWMITWYCKHHDIINLYFIFFACHMATWCPARPCHGRAAGAGTVASAAGLAGRRGQKARDATTWRWRGQGVDGQIWSVSHDASGTWHHVTNNHSLILNKEYIRLWRKIDKIYNKN